MCFPIPEIREREPNPFDHVLTAKITTIMVIIISTNGYSRKSVSAMPYIIWPPVSAGKYSVRVFHVSPLCALFVFIYLFIYLLLYTYDMMLITARDSTREVVGWGWKGCPREDNTVRHGGRSQSL